MVLSQSHQEEKKKTLKSKLENILEITDLPPLKIGKVMKYNETLKGCKRLEKIIRFLLPLEQITKNLVT